MGIRYIRSAIDEINVLTVSVNSKFQFICFFVYETHHRGRYSIGSYDEDFLCHLEVHLSQSDVNHAVFFNTSFFLFVINSAWTTNCALFSDNIEHFACVLTGDTSLTVKVRLFFGALFPWIEWLFDFDDCFDLLFWVPTFEHICSLA